MQHLKIPAFRGWARRTFAAVKTFKLLHLSNAQLRFNTTQIDCNHVELKCGDRFQQGPCLTQQVNTKLKKQLASTALPVQERGIRLRRPYECCGSPCQDALPRFDQLYYKRTNKFERKYQQTWDECPELLKKPKVVCCFDKIQPAKLKKRPRQERPQTACSQTCSTLQSKCRFITSKGCRPARHPSKCYKVRIKTHCYKLPAPCSAFSECSPKLPGIRPIECRCLLMPSLCEVWSNYHYLEKIKKNRVC